MKATSRECSEDFDEADLFEEREEAADHAPHEEDASSSWREQEELQSTSRAHGGGDTGPGSNRSGTTIMQDILEDEPVEVFRAAAMPIAASLPMHHQAGARMGSSVPMNIPYLMGRPVKVEEKESQEEEVHYPGTFIPPHQLSQHDGFMFSLTGASPSIAKKERLRARNAILLSTGFLENQESLPIQDRAKFVAKSAGGLSQALQSS